MECEDLFERFLGQKQQEKGPLGYGFDASFCRQTWGKVSAMFSQIKDCKCEKNRGESPLPYRHQIGDGSIVIVLDERETQGYSIEHLTEDGFCKDNHYI